MYKNKAGSQFLVKVEEGNWGGGDKNIFHFMVRQSVYLLWMSPIPCQSASSHCIARSQPVPIQLLATLLPTAAVGSSDCTHHYLIYCVMGHDGNSWVNDD